MIDEHNYVAIIGDLKNSRHSGDRRAAQSTVENALESMNGRYASEFSAGFVVTIGEEFQGLRRHHSWRHDCRGQDLPCPYRVAAEEGG